MQPGNVYRLRRSGNMHAEREQQQRITQGIRLAKIQGGMTVTAEIRHMRWERNLPMRGNFMICMGMCLNGVGTGMAITQAKRRQILWARPRGLSVCCAAVAGAIRLCTCLPRTGSATPRTSGTTASAASGSSATSLTVQVE